MFRFVVNKKYLTSKVLEIYGQKAEIAPSMGPHVLILFFAKNESDEPEVSGFVFYKSCIYRHLLLKKCIQSNLRTLQLNLTKKLS